MNADRRGLMAAKRHKIRKMLKDKLPQEGAEITRGFRRTEEKAKGLAAKKRNDYHHIRARRR